MHKKRKKISGVNQVLTDVLFFIWLLAITYSLWPGADLGGGGADAPPPSSGILPPADSKGLPFDTFSEIHFWPTDPKIFLKAHLAPIYTNFEGERAPKNAIFLSTFFKKCPKTVFFLLFFKNLPAAQKI